MEKDELSDGGSNSSSSDSSIESSSDDESSRLVSASNSKILRGNKKGPPGSYDSDGDHDNEVNIVAKADNNDQLSESSQSSVDIEVKSDSSDESDEDEDDNVDLPLHERVQRNEERGLSLSGVRARRSHALKVASDRLAELKQKKSSRHNNQNAGDSADPSTERIKKAKKKSKHAPTEVSSKRADFFKRGARRLNESGLGVEIGANRYKSVDPRTSNLAGHLDEDNFEHNYKFLEEMRDKEIAQLKKRIAARTKFTGNKGKKLRRKLQTNTSTLEEDQQELQKLVAAKAQLERNRVERTAKRAVNKRLREEVEQGKHGAYFLKKRDRKRLELEAKFDEIRKRGGDKAVEKVLAKKRRKNKSRDAGMFAK